MSQSCHCEAPQGPWQSRRTVLNFRKISANSKHFTGDSHVASLLGMTKRRLFAIPRIPRRFPLVFPPRPSAEQVFRHPDTKTKCTVRQAGRSACQKVPSGLLPSCLQNCKTFCSTVLQFCRCGRLLNAKGNPDGFLSLFSSLRNLRLGSFFASPFRKNEMYRPASRTVSLSKSPFGSFAKLPSKLQNVFCSSVLQFCRCGGLLNAKGNPDGFLVL